MEAQLGNLAARISRRRRRETKFFEAECTGKSAMPATTGALRNAGLGGAGPGGPLGRFGWRSAGLDEVRLGRVCGARAGGSSVRWAGPVNDDIHLRL